MTNDQIRSQRKHITAEVFTPPELTNEILDKLPPSVWEPNKTFCDPAAGNGNIVLEILKRKLSHGHNPLQAIQTLWGVDLMEDNIKEAHERLLNEIPVKYHPKAKDILNEQFICHDALTWDFIKWCPRGSNKLISKRLF